MKIVNYILAIIFTLFAYVQFNDPDGYIWVITYMIVAIVSLLAALGKYNVITLKLLIALFFIGLLWLTPALYDAIAQYDPNKVADPTITHATNAQTEAMNEFFGLLLGALTLVFHYRKADK